MRAGIIDMESNTTLVQCYPAHEAVPDGPGPFPAVILLHGPFGLDSFTRATANRLAREGFYVLAPDFYASPSSFAAVAPAYMRRPTGGTFDRTEREAAIVRAEHLSDEGAMTVFRQALGYLSVRACARGSAAAVIGFGSGARLALLGAATHPADVKACVGYAPTSVTRGAAGGARVLDRVGEITCPILLVYGGLDVSVDRREREALVARLTTEGKRLDVRVFREAERDFFVTDADGYDISASRAAWAAALALLRDTA